MFARSPRFSPLSASWGLPSNAKRILREGDAEAIEQLLGSRPSESDGLVGRSPALKYFAMAKDLLCALVQTEKLKGQPETWPATEEQAAVLRRAMGLMDAVMAGSAAPSPAETYSGAGAEVPAAQWQRLVVAYRVRKNRLIESILDWV